MLEWIDAKQIRNDLQRLKDSKNLKLLERKLKDLSEKRKEIQFQRSVAQYVRENIISAYKLSKRFPSIGETTYLDKYIDENDDKYYMMGKIDDTYFLSYKKGKSKELVLFEKTSSYLNDTNIVYSFKVTTIELGIFNAILSKTVKSIEIPAICFDNGQLINNEKYCELLNKARCIDDRKKYYYSSLTKK